MSGAGKGDVRRPEAERGLFEKGYDQIDWGSGRFKASDHSKRCYGPGCMCKHVGFVGHRPQSDNTLANRSLGRAQRV